MYPTRGIHVNNQNCNSTIQIINKIKKKREWPETILHRTSRNRKSAVYHPKNTTLHKIFTIGRSGHQNAHKRERGAPITNHSHRFKTSKVMSAPYVDCRCGKSYYYIQES
ncbi:hypothetical protein MKX03_036315 [Papaver bracteatum]|nr:hypothetical protein MKX03_036315 [Papaver bracteatum]